MIYNGFGLTYTDIINAFNGSSEDNFATNGRCGSKIITEVIEMKEAELSSHFSESFTNYLERLPDHYVTTFELSGASAFWFDFAPDETRDIRVKVVSKCADMLTVQECSNSCGSSEIIEIYYDIDEEKWFGLLDRIIEKNQQIVLSYSVDVSQLILPSVMVIIRSGVCCELGTMLYSEGENRWQVVTDFCEQWSKWLEKIGGDWLPAEFKRLRLLEWDGPFRAVRYNRVNENWNNWRSRP